MKVLIFGKGYIAHKFFDYIEREGCEVSFSDVRVKDYLDVFNELKSEKPDVVLNCIGKTGRPNVDWCEDHKEETIFGNVLVPVLMARACEKLGLYMVHVGSGCVYTGDKNGVGFSEEDDPNFDGSFYSKTKAWSEDILRSFPVLQLRLRMPLDSEPGGRNFLTKILTYEKVISVPNSLSILDDFMKAGFELMKQGAVGVFNMTNPGIIDHEEILDMYKEIVDPDFEYELMTLDEMEKITKAGRSNCGLSTQKMEKYGVRMRPVREALREVLIDYKKNLESCKQ